jgi:DNA repair protein RecO (recombination protein O)
MEYKYTGIILGKKDVGETDRIYTVYTLEGGKIRSLAKGVRRSHARLAASLENITLTDLTIMRTRGLGKITGSIIENSFAAIKRDGEATLQVFLALGMFDKLVDLENVDSKVFQLLKSYLETMDGCAEKGDSEKYLVLRLGFSVKLLEALGYSIEVSACVSCGLPLSQDVLCFSSQHGGALCGDCSAKNQECAVPIRANAVKMMRLFLNNDIASFTKLKAEKKDCDSVQLALEDFLRWNT